MRRVIAVISVVALLSLMAYSYLEHDEKDPDMNWQKLQTEQELKEARL